MQVFRFVEDFQVGQGGAQFDQQRGLVDPGQYAIQALVVEDVHRLTVVVVVGAGVGRIGFPAWTRAWAASTTSILVRPVSVQVQRLKPSARLLADSGIRLH
ncbi:hypothetical protein D3C78_1530390 [compost metagenome]